MIIQILKEIIKDTAFRLGEARVIDVQGFKMWINPKDSYVMRKTFRAYEGNRVHEPATTELFRKIVKRGDFVIDIGANIGYFSLLSASLGARVKAFEPGLKNIQYLNKNININSYMMIKTELIAISNEDGVTDLFMCPYDSGHHTINQDKGIKDYRKTSLMRKCLDLFLKKQKSESVVMKRLDDFKLTPDIIKMDCEGAEALALEGMNETLNRSPNIKMVIEFFPLLLRSMGSSPKDFINKLLNNYKFRMFIIPDDYDAVSGKMIEVKEYMELLQCCSGEEDHLNLYLKRS